MDLIILGMIFFLIHSINMPLGIDAYAYAMQRKASIIKEITNIKAMNSVK